MTAVILNSQRTNLSYFTLLAMQFITSFNEFHSAKYSLKGSRFTWNMQINADSSCIDHEKLCHNIMGCVGFNSKGYLKDRLLPYTNWTISSREKGIFVLGKYFYIYYISFLFFTPRKILGYICYLCWETFLLHTPNTLNTTVLHPHSFLPRRTFPPTFLSFHDS